MLLIESQEVDAVEAALKQTQVIGKRHNVAHFEDQATALLKNLQSSQADWCPLGQLMIELLYLVLEMAD